jgi:hypothetical protein
MTGTIIGVIGLGVTGISLVVTGIALWHAIIQSKRAKVASDKIVLLQSETVELIKQTRDSKLTEEEKSKVISEYLVTVQSIVYSPVSFKSVAVSEAPTIVSEYKPEKPNSED